MSSPMGKILADLGTEPITVPLGDKTVRVLPPKDWRSSAMGAILTGDFEKWASKCLVEGDYAIWQSVDPTLGQIGEFMEAYQQAGGLGLGESRTSLT